MNLLQCTSMSSGCLATLQFQGSRLVPRMFVCFDFSTVFFASHTASGTSAVWKTSTTFFFFYYLKKKKLLIFFFSVSTLARSSSHPTPRRARRQCEKPQQQLFFFNFFFFWNCYYYYYLKKKIIIIIYFFSVSTLARPSSHPTPRRVQLSQKPQIIAPI